MEIYDTVKAFEYRFFLNEIRSMNKVKKRTKINLTYNSLLYLEMIYHTEECTVSQISNLLDVAKSSVTLKVNELVKLGLVTRNQSAKDSRVYWLKLTDKGHEYRSTFDMAKDYGIRKVEESCTKEEIASFCKVMDLYIEHYYKHLGDEADGKYN